MNKTFKTQTEENIIKNWNNKQTLVSIVCITYNHENYIEEAIRSFLMQKTNFAFEIIIHDDASTDETTKIITSYKKKYPSIIKTIIQKENQYSKGIRPVCAIKNKALSKYIAFCEGDDYWIDEYKIQKQFQKLEENDNIDICIHSAITHNLINNKKTIDFEHDTHDCIIPGYLPASSKTQFSPTASYFFRNTSFKKMPNWFFNDKLPFSDYFIETIIGKKGLAYIAQPMSVYRLNVKNSYTMRTRHVSVDTLYEQFINTIKSTKKLNEIQNISKYAINRRIEYLYQDYIKKAILIKSYSLYSKILKQVKSNNIKIIDDIDLIDFHFELINKLDFNSRVIIYGVNALSFLLYDSLTSRVDEVIDKHLFGNKFDRINIRKLNQIPKIDTKNTTFVITAINQKFIKQIQDTIKSIYPNANIINIEHKNLKHNKYHELSKGIKLTQESQKRLEFFLKTEEIQVSILLNAIKKIKPDLFIDIGANVGLYTLIINKYFPELHCYCFEPTPNILYDLNENIRLNSITNTSIYPIALSSKTGQAQFLDFGINSGKNSLLDTTIHHKSLNQANKLTVKTKDLDSVFNTAKKTYILKIDVEGNELDVLVGAKNLLINNSCLLQIEIEYNDYKKIYLYLKELGYHKIIKIGPDILFTNISKLLINKNNLLETSLSSLIQTKWSKSFDFQ